MEECGIKVTRNPGEMGKTLQVGPQVERRRAWITAQRPAAAAGRPAAAPASRVPAAGRFAIVPYAATIFLSSFLLFLVQPIIAKQILPWFGGSAAVWTTCLVFFQAVLLAGYAIRRPDHAPRARGGRRCCMSGCWCCRSPACRSWPPPAGSRMGDEEPVGRILLLLTGQRSACLISCFRPRRRSCRHGTGSDSAARCRIGFFALSNFASLLALIGFPVLLEPYFTLPQLGWAWSAMYAPASMALCGATAWRSMRAIAAQPAAAEASGDAGPPSAPLTGAWSSSSLARPCGTRFGHAAGGQQPRHPEHFERALPLGAPAGAVPDHVHLRVRPSRAGIGARHSWPCARRADAVDGLRDRLR